MQAKPQALKAHNLCLTTESISQLTAGCGTTIGGYSITKSPIYSDRFEKISSAIPRKLQQLRVLTATSPEEDQIAYLIGAQSISVIDTCREAKAMIDDPKMNPENMRKRHFFKTAADVAEQLDRDIQKLREKRGLIL